VCTWGAIAKPEEYERLHSTSSGVSEQGQAIWRIEVPGGVQGRHFGSLLSDRNPWSKWIPQNLNSFCRLTSCFNSSFVHLDYIIRGHGVSSARKNIDDKIKRTTILAPAGHKLCTLESLYICKYIVMHRRANYTLLCNCTELQIRLVWSN